MTASWQHKQLTYCALTGAVFLLAAACQHQDTSQPPPPQAAAPPPPAPPPAGQPPPAAGAPAQQQAAKPVMPKPLVVKDAGLQTPESVLYDSEADVYLVSNVNGKPLDKDNNGFISKVGPDGKVVELKWIDGAKPGVQLSAPKGMAIANDMLYVTDINFIRLFDKKTGAAKGKLGVPAATFLNDLAATKDGTVYVSDSGLKAGKEGFEPSGTDSVYKIPAGKAPQKVAANKDLGSPNGLAPGQDGVWVVTYTSGELYKLGKDGKKQQAQTLPSGALDGIVKLPDGSLLISSWKGSAVYRGKPGGTFEAVVQNVQAPADIGYDSKRNTLVIPLFQSNALQIQKLPDVYKTAPAAPPAPPAKSEQPAAPQQAAGQKPGAQKPQQTSQAATKPAAPPPAKAGTPPQTPPPPKQK